MIIDGNTLDPTLQVLLAAQRAVGITGLVVDDDVVASRTLMREACRALPGPQIHVAVNDMSIPGPGGDIPVRHYRPAVAEPAPLLVFYHGGGWTIGDLDTHDPLCRLTCRDADMHVLSIDYRLAPNTRLRPVLTTPTRPFAGPMNTPPNSAQSRATWRSAAIARAAIWRPSCRNQRGLTVARGRAAVARLPQNRFHRAHPLAVVVRRRFLAHQTRHRLVRNPIPGRLRSRADRSTGVAVACRGLVRAAARVDRNRRLRPLRDEGEQYAAALRAAGTRSTCAP
ncbi:alpha/beta hydrolase fold family protein [Mycobacterium xenopi 4042]|uniref:Alpha/beta hydrolase fold family protein n=1 Tax=Mycobacterium xenopi 4042 TaxID=1299334 RepID=X8E8P3_MYCXE|nr:alpha/beta hydrolase fold family protein [Mycobacterium xenopi 4042]